MRRHLLLKSCSFVLGGLLLCMGAQAAPRDALARIKASRSVAVAYRTDALPFSFEDNAKQATGYSVDLCRKVVASIGEQLGVGDLRIKWVPVGLKNRMDVVAKGQADMECGATTVTLSRMKQVAFSNYIFIDGTGLIVKNDAGIRSLDDLAGKKLGVLPGTTNEQALQDALKQKLVNATVVPVASREDGLARFEAGELDAFVGDRVLLVGLAPKSKDPKSVLMLDDTLSMEPYAIVLPRGDEDLRLAVNTALSRIYRSAVIGELYGRWFGGLGKPGAVLQANYILGAVPE